ncbi:MAG: ABC transporter substrate-binding protein [Acidimicrobiales bacterium]|nr:ABC transporter substrate-binding protein [Acidimicrobiales bacterium]HLV90385.1 ABC transporter substrate-binding protein [Acidimicrobiia bacterium]
MRTNRSRAIGAGLLALVMLMAACGDSGDGANDGPEVVIAAQDFGESEILAEIYKGALESKGYTARVQRVGGFRDLELAAFESGDVNLAPEYAASMLEYLNEGAGEATGDAAATTDLLNGYIEELGLVALTPSDAVDTNAFVVTAETSESLGITSLSDLAEKGADLTLGGPPDCETNPFCIPGLQRVYGLDLSANFTPLQAGLPTADALEQDAIDVGILFSTSAIIADRGYVLLEDDQNMLAADNVVPVLTNDLLEAYGDELRNLLDEISSKLTTADLTAMNKRFEIDNEDADAIAADWLADNGY